MMLHQQLEALVRTHGHGEVERVLKLIAMDISIDPYTISDPVKPLDQPCEATFKAHCHYPKCDCARPHKCALPDNWPRLDP